MIKNQWYAIASSKQIKRNKLYGMKRLGEDIVLFRNSAGKIRCVSDRCPHRGASVGDGCLHHGNLQCPFHGLEFDESGKCVCVPAEGRTSKKNYSRFDLKHYPAREIGGIIFIWYGDGKLAGRSSGNADGKLADGASGNADGKLAGKRNGKPMGKPPVFDVMLDKKFKYGHIDDVWKVHYSRAIENQLDVSHLAFVHHNTIGRGNKTVSNGPKVIWLDENTLQTSANNEVDSGQTSQNADACTIKSTNLIFKYPNIWMNTINEKMRILAYFVPIDEESCILAVRFYTKMTGIAIVDNLIAWLGKWANLVVERQDKRVVEKQRPKKTARKIDERLMMADKPIIEYRRRREELQTEAE